MIRSLFITAHKREKVFFLTLNKLKKCKNYKKFKILVIYQDVRRSVVKKIKQIDPKIEIIKTKYKKETSIIHKNNMNMYLGFKKCFESYKSQYVIYLEDDLIPSYDFLEFHNFINLKYRNDQKFFATNSFSMEYSRNKDFFYSKFIYGIGKGWSIPKERWHILKKWFEELIYKNIFSFNDFFFEYKIKRKYFVIMPYRARTCEQPSIGVSTDLAYFKSNHYLSIKKSFLKEKKYEIKKYVFDPSMKYNWRKDCKNYLAYNIFKNNLFFLKLIFKNFIKKILNSPINIYH